MTMSNDIKHLGTDLSSLNEVKIFDANGKLKKIVKAERLMDVIGQFKQTKRANKKNLKKKKASKKLLASDLIKL